MDEIEVLLDVIQARLIQIILIPAWHVQLQPQNSEYILSEAKASWSTFYGLLKTERSKADKELLSVAVTVPPDSTHKISQLEPPPSIEDLLKRRARDLGPSYRLFYNKPVHLVEGKGVWLYDSEGKRYLDLYNNVPHVGHCHPKVTAALVRQANTLNTHTRYLHENILKFSENLNSTLPPQCRHMTVCIFTCTGSEANDLALRIAMAYTGHKGFLISENAYHGGTFLTRQLSPESETTNERAHYQQLDHNYIMKNHLPPYIKTIPPPNPYERKYRKRKDVPEMSHFSDTEYFLHFAKNAISELQKNGSGLAASLIDTIFSSNGIVDAPPDFFSKLFSLVHEAGGLAIADEVQSGLGRDGESFWGFAGHGKEVVPDIITLGKPLGNGHPVGVVITSPHVIQRFSNETNYFNTFGGNCVSCLVGLTVLEVIREEGLIENCHVVGKFLKDSLKDLMSRFECIGDVRGKGLSIGVEMVRDRVEHVPDPVLADRVVNGLKDRGVLISSTGMFSNVLKIRPPLVLQKEHVLLFISLFSEVLVDVLKGKDPLPVSKL
eukprot:TRINITY_DN2160_c0_g1_i12.p1 TRINITY_DN2160_c0_g1~~TRINITY_DN2160_c0_g1_i12.p1  ORF type:complete len:550 (-),score=100.13 TRINITY_DN2160_c0_g1_i12:183-1832(-)